MTTTFSHALYFTWFPIIIDPFGVCSPTARHDGTGASDYYGISRMHCAAQAGQTVSHEYDREGHDVRIDAPLLHARTVRKRTHLFTHVYLNRLQQIDAQNHRCAHIHSTSFQTHVSIYINASICVTLCMCLT